MESGKGHILQIFNMDKKEKLKHIEFPENIVFWRWVADDLLAVVTTSSVFHISLKADTKEQKMFDRAEKLK